MKKQKKIVIIGAGGLGKEIYGYIQSDINSGYLKDFKFKGFIDDSYKLGNKHLDLGSINEYQPDEIDYFLVALGNIKVRSRIINNLENKGVNFLNYKHSTAYVAPDVEFGKGNFLAPFTLINASSVIGNHNFLNSYSSIGHDCQLGNNNVLSPYSTILGECKLGDSNYLSTRASVYPRLAIGNNCVVSMSTNVISDLNSNITCFQRFKSKKLDNSVT